MKYVECLNLIKEKNLNINQMLVAQEVYDQLIETHLVNNYEEVCQYIYSCSLETDNITVAILTECFKDLIKVDGLTEERIMNMSYYKFIEKASYY